MIQTCEGSNEKQLNDIKALEAAGVYYVSWWNKPENVKAWDYPHWVAHEAFDGISAGEFAANVLFKKMGGKGKIVAIKGMLANSIAIDRYKGLGNILAKNPNIKLVASDTAEWDRTKAFEKMKSFLVANPDLGGVWAANDNMALGALEALRAAGEAAATVLNDSFWQGGMGLALALAAKNGKIVLSKTPKYDWNDLYAFYVRAMP